MGKPFEKELERIEETLIWSMGLDVGDFRSAILSDCKPVIVVGSGGSLSACHYACCLLQEHGILAKAVTPLELYYLRHTIKQSNVLFISASGKNTDILFSYELAVKNEPRHIFSICMTDDSPLGTLAKQTSFAYHLEYINPAGKDGFLATNSLIAFFGVLFKSLSTELYEKTTEASVDSNYLNSLDSFLGKVSPDFTFTLLYGGWGQPVAIDLESKIAEAALSDVLLSDYRNFGHGRHHWFAKRKKNSAIVVIITPTEKELAEKTVGLLPSDIPILKIQTSRKNASSTIELLLKAFHFINKLGKMQKIDPGRPGVPAFGSKLYKLNYSIFFKQPIQSLTSAILKKAHVLSLNDLSENESKYWHESYKQFKSNLSHSGFGAVIFDYDGTLCSSSDRFNGISVEVRAALVRLLENGMILGIATGRGKSVREDLCNTLPKEFHDKVIVGYYNCGDIAPLGDSEHPNKNLPVGENLREIYDMLISYSFSLPIEPELKPNQITIEIGDKLQWNRVRSTLIQLVRSKQASNIEILESSHSMDIIDSIKTSKLKIIDVCSKMLKNMNLSSGCLCIGDKGQWPGNDYALLSTELSLSVDEVSSINNSCWNLCPTGVRNVDATLYYLKHIFFKNNVAYIKLS